MAADAALDMDYLRAWIGRCETVRDAVTPHLVRAYRATVHDEESEPQPGDPVPQGLHWCLALPIVPMHALGPDGHPARGGFLPPVPLPRRMWAGSRVRFHDALRVGDAVERRSEIRDLTVKEGRSGTLCFVSVVHSFHSPRGTAVEEEQDIVYRGAEAASSAGTAAAAAPAAAQEPEPAAFRRILESSPTLLFRYSALTFNGHRIHYDRTYATGAENYPGLVVHGPLQAALLLALAQTMRPERAVRAFAFRGLRPLFDGGAIVLSGAWTGADAADLWTGPTRAAPNLQGSARWD